MTVVEACIGGKKILTPDNVDMFTPTALSLLIEGIAQNTTGSVFEPEVNVPPDYRFLLLTTCCCCV